MRCTRRTAFLGAVGLTGVATAVFLGPLLPGARDAPRTSIELPSPPDATRPAPLDPGDAMPHVSSPRDLRGLRQRIREAAADPERLERWALEAPDASVAGRAVRELGLLGRCRVDSRLLRLLDDARLRVRQEVVVALGRSGDRRGVDLLARYLTPEADPRMQTLALEALGRLGGPAARGLLEAFLARERTPEVSRHWARRALSALAGTI